jgi:uncharacterized metal-binding protein YceD (DUF177 family)
MKTNSPAEPVWNHLVTVADIAEEGEDLTLAPDAETRAALARFADVIAVPAFSARLHLQPDGAGGAVVTGELDATVKQNSVVSLEPFDNKVHEEIAIRFAPEGAASKAPDPDIELYEPDPTDAVRDGVIDLGAMVSEFLVLGIDPYPRKPGEVFSPPEPGAAEKADNPFAALEKLKKKGRSSD